MNIEKLKLSAVDWFLATILPQMSFAEQCGACLKIWGNRDKLSAALSDELDKAGLLHEGEVDADTLMREIVDGMMFKFRDYVPVVLGDSEYRIRKENIGEIVENAKRL